MNYTFLASGINQKNLLKSRVSVLRGIWVLSAINRLSGILAPFWFQIIWKHWWQSWWPGVATVPKCAKTYYLWWKWKGKWMNWKYRLRKHLNSGVSMWFFATKYGIVRLNAKKVLEPIKKRIIATFMESKKIDVFPSIMFDGINYSRSFSDRYSLQELFERSIDTLWKRLDLIDTHTLCRNINVSSHNFPWALVEMN